MSNISAPFAGDKTEFHITAAISGTIDSTTLVGEVTDITASELTRKMVEYMAYGQEYTQKLAGKKEASSTSITLAWTPGNADHTELKARFDDGVPQSFAIRWVSGAENATMELTGIVESYAVGAPQEDVVPLTISISVHGAPALDLTTAT